MVVDLDKILDKGISHETKGAVTIVTPSKHKLKLSNAELAQCDAWMKDQFRWITADRKFWFGLESIIGLGKSTFLEHILRDYITAREFYEETYSPFLKLFYHNLRIPKSKMGFFMQLYLPERRADMGAEILGLTRGSGAEDRTPPGENVFIELLHDKYRAIEDEEALWAEKAVATKINDVGMPEIFITLDAGEQTPEIAYKRVGQRGRDYEVGKGRRASKIEVVDMLKAKEIIAKCVKRHLPHRAWKKYIPHLKEISVPKTIVGGTLDKQYLKDQHEVFSRSFEKNLIKLRRRCYVVRTTVGELPPEKDPRISIEEKFESVRPIYYTARLLLNHGGYKLEDRMDQGRRRIIGPYSRNPTKRDYNPPLNSRGPIKLD